MRLADVQRILPNFPPFVGGPHALTTRVSPSCHLIFHKASQRRLHLLAERTPDSRIRAHGDAALICMQPAGEVPDPGIAPPSRSALIASW